MSRAGKDRRVTWPSWPQYRSFNDHDGDSEVGKKESDECGPSADDANRMEERERVRVFVGAQR